ncbi:uncharacterized protein G2W53_004318 [Senna tora]|uniref:Uncharacterized protein n=1 Tax=Senna tora TaxID=362788 RepID=A0A834XBG3_9FABA|nr:uncharacterized protein G2W53_004318 [Senna tora]
MEEVSQTDRLAYIREFQWISSSIGASGRMEELKMYKYERVVAQASQKDRFALYLGIRVDFMLEWGF